MPPYRQSPARRQPKLLVRGSKVSLGALVRSSASDDRQKAYSVRLSSVVPMQPPTNLPDFQVMRGRTLTAENTHEHTQRAFWPRNVPLTPTTPILVDCSCPRYAFYYEWANAQQGCGFIYRSNGDPPSTTNPGHKRGCCKHLVRFLSYLLKQSRGPASAPTATPARSAAPPRPNAAPPRRGR